MTTLARAKKLYRSFREREPTRIGTVSIPKAPRAVMVLGYLRALEYDTTHGHSQGYRHTFKAGSRPLLCSDGKRLYIVRGRFKVTARGIVDTDRDGREES